MCRRQPGIGKFPHHYQPIYVFLRVLHFFFTQPLAVSVRNAMESGEFVFSFSPPRLAFVAMGHAHMTICPWFSPVCDSYVRPETLVRICDECNFGTYGGRCIICGSPGEGFPPFVVPLLCSALLCSHTWPFLASFRDLGRLLLC
jgi:hypothetical protein